MEIQKEGNLLQRQSLVSKTTGIRVVSPGGLYKSIALNALTVIAAFAFSYTFRGYLDGSTSIVMPLIVLTLFSAFSALCVFLVKSFGERSIALLLEAAGCISFFYDQPLNLLGPIFALLLFFFFWGEIAGRREASELMHLRFYRVTKLQLKRVVTGLVLMTVLFYLPQWETKESFISQDAFRTLFDWSGGVSKNFYSDLNFTGTFHDLIDSSLRSQLKTDEAFNALPVDARELLIAQKIKQVTTQLNTQSGTSIQPEDPANQAFYQLVIAAIRQWKNSYGVGFVVAWGIALFFAVQSVGILSQTISIALAFVFYQLLLAFNVIHITGESRTREGIEFS